MEQQREEWGGGVRGLGLWVWRLSDCSQKSKPRGSSGAQRSRTEVPPADLASYRSQGVQRSSEFSFRSEAWESSLFEKVQFSSVQFSSVAQSCPTLCYPMNRSTPGLPVHPQLPEFTQTHVHRVGDAIQPSHPLSSPSPPAPQSLPASESFPMSQLFS